MPIHVRYKEHPQEVLGKPTPTPGDVREFARYVALQEALHIFPDSEKIRRLAAGLGERRSKLGVALHVHIAGHAMRLTAFCMTASGNFMRLTSPIRTGQLVKGFNP